MDAEIVLQVEDLQYRYDDGTHALQGIELAIARNEKVGLVGPNGSGKSTLLMCLNGLYAGKGIIRVAGEEFTRSRMKEMRTHVGLVFQSPDDQLFMPTLQDDLAFGPINLGLDSTSVQRRVDEVASRMQLTDLLDKAPHHLSMGQKRNAAIATVLAMQPTMLLMDEPSSNLDPKSRRRLIDLLQQLEATILVASHDLALVGNLCSRVILIDRGKVVTEGPTADILADKNLMEEHGLEVWRDS